MPTFDFNSPLYRAHSQKSTKRNPPSPSTPIQTQAAPFDVNAIIQLFQQMAGQQQQADLGMQREAQGGIRRDISGQPINQSAPQGPWSGPIMFKSPEERYAEMAKYPRANVPPRNDYGNPYFAGPLPSAPAPAPAAMPTAGSYIPSQQPGMFDFVGPTSATSGGGNLLGQVAAGSATAAPAMPGYAPSPAGNMFPAPARTPAPKPQPKKRFSFGAGTFR